MIIFSRDEFNFYTHVTWLHRINTDKAVQLSSDRGRHGLQLQMPFVVFMNEGCLVWDAMFLVLVKYNVTLQTLHLNFSMN